MTGAELKRARLDGGWSQPRLATRLGVTQAYVSLMEAGRRRVPDRVARAVTSLFGLPPTRLPFDAPKALAPGEAEEQLEQGLAGLGYPPLDYKGKSARRRNPMELLLMGLSVDNLDPRLVEGLPWLLVGFEGFDSEELVSRARSGELQNRLGFTVSLARRVAERNPLYLSRRADLARLEETLERSRLAREDSYGRAETSEQMRAWLRTNRTPEAEHWNLLTDLKPEHLPYAGQDLGALGKSTRPRGQKVTK